MCIIVVVVEHDGEESLFQLLQNKKNSRAKRSAQKLLTIHTLALPILLYSLFPVQLLLPNKCFMSPSNRALLAPGEAERGSGKKENWRSRGVGVVYCGALVLMDGWVDGQMLKM